MQHWICDDTQEAEKENLHYNFMSSAFSKCPDARTRTRCFKLHIVPTRFCEDIKLARWMCKRYRRWWRQTAWRNVIQVMLNGTTGLIFKWRHTASLWLDAALFQSEAAPTTNTPHPPTLYWMPIAGWRRRLIQGTHFKNHPRLQGWRWTKTGKWNFMSCQQGSSVCCLVMKLEKIATLSAEGWGEGGSLSPDMLLLSPKGTHGPLLLQHGSCNS